MSEGLNYPFTAEQISDYATLNASAFILAIMAYAKEHSLPTDGLFSSFGRIFAPAWEGVRGTPVGEVAKWMALHQVSTGAELRSLSEDEVQAQIVIVGWPSEEHLEHFGLTREDTDAFRVIPATIAEYLGLAYEWNRDADEIAQIFSRPGSV